jgi:tRNA threonylcarbamoyladenosine biosynthesis protein TsaB
MKVLGINTATVFGSVGLVDGDRVMGEYSLNIPITHSERLMTCVDHLLRDTRVPLEELEGFSIALGPGSFTGLRIGTSTVKGLAFATGQPIAGVSTLEALALNLFDCKSEICPILDARKKETYAARFRADGPRRIKRLTPDRVIAPKDLAKEIHEPVVFLGDGVEVYGNFLRRILGRLAAFAPAEFGYVHGAVVARMGVEYIRKGKILDLAGFVPHYIRRSEAEIRYKETGRKAT